MAELLILAVNHTHPDPTKDQRGSYKRGDIVAVMEDGHQWGRMETLPTFVKVKIPGVPASRVQRYLQSATETDQFTGHPITVRRRLWSVLVDNIPLSIRRTLQNTGEVTVSWEQVRNYVRDKLTNTVAEPIEGV